MNSIRKKIGIATCSLLAQQANAQSFENDWIVDTAALSYQESDDRVSVNKVIVNLKGKMSDNDDINLNLVHDTMSGASPTGAIKSGTESVTFTGASGGAFTTSTETASLVEIDDSRLSMGLDWDHELDRGFKAQFGGSVSTENDYDSIATSLGVEKESNNKLVTYNAVLAFTADTIYRSGSSDTPSPLASLSESQTFDKGERNTWDLFTGITRILNRRTLGQVNLTYSRSQGYHTDPYKVISVADSNRNVVDTYYENRPGERTRASLFTNIAHELSANDNIVHASYRLYQDDWNIRSHTVNLKYHNKLSNKQFLEPNVRLYKQTAADFYKNHLHVDENINVVIPDNNFASADYRLDRFWSYTIGLKYGRPLGKSGDLRLRAEFIKQTFAHSEFKVNEAAVLQASYKYSF